MRRPLYAVEEACVRTRRWEKVPALSNKQSIDPVAIKIDCPSHGDPKIQPSARRTRSCPCNQGCPQHCCCMHVPSITAVSILGGCLCNRRLSLQSEAVSTTMAAPPSKEALQPEALQPEALQSEATPAISAISNQHPQSATRNCLTWPGRCDLTVAEGKTLCALVAFVQLVITLCDAIWRTL